MVRVARRRFIGLGLGVAGAMCIVDGTRPASMLAGTADLVLFDRRFRRAAALAFRFADGGSMQPIAGDATELALWFRSQASWGRRTSIRGVTTESVPFCLQQIAPRAQWSIRRIDRDLFVWTALLPA